MHAIKTEHLRKEFWLGLRRKHFVALDSLSLQVETGEVFGVLGPNGSGKTTAMKVLTGLCAPTSGKAWLLGQPVGNVAVKNDIGFLPEHPYFYDYLTANEFLTFYGRLFCIESLSRTKRIDELLERVGLSDQRQTRLRHFSKGMLQRIGIAQALINDPLLVLLDEPMSGLDPVGRRAVRDIILQLKSEGKTVFFSSHILPDVEMICDRVAIMMRGRLLAMGTVRDLVGSDSGQAVDVELQGVSPEGVAKIKEVSDNVVVRQEQVFVVLDDSEQVDDLLRIAKACGAQLRSLTPQRASLESIFLREVSKSRHEVS
jgi:ABC-2 type transport system ATP-binding protein